MKIIKPGTNPDQRWTTQASCTGLGMTSYNERITGCGALLELERDDLYFASGGYQERDDTHYVAFMCPQCNSISKLPASQEPPYLVGYQYHSITELFRQASSLMGKKPGIDNEK